MAIQTGNGADYLPRESVVTSVLNLFNTFSKEGKDRRQAETDLTRAQARNIDDMINWRPDASAQGWDQLGTARERLGIDREQNRNMNNRNMIDLFQTTGAQPDNQRNALLASILRSVGAEDAAKVVEEAERKQRETMDAMQKRLRGEGAEGPKQESGMFGKIADQATEVVEGPRKDDGLTSGLLNSFRDLFRWFDPSIDKTKNTVTPRSNQPETRKAELNVPNPSFSGEGWGTIFGHNLDGSPDSQDNGLGAFGANTRTPGTHGVSLPYSTLNQVFGSHQNADAIRNARVRVINPATGQEILAPIVDKGPAAWTGNSIDLTGTTGKAIGATGKDKLLFEIIAGLPRLD